MLLLLFIPQTRIHNTEKNMKVVAAVFLEGNSLFLNTNLLQNEFGSLERIRSYFKS